MALTSVDPLFEAPFTNGDIQFTLDGAGQQTIGGITDINISTNTETSADGSGHIYDERRSVISQEPTASFTTNDVGAMLSGTGILGGCLDGTTGFVAQTVRQSCKGPDTASTHGIYQIKSGLLQLDTLSADARTDATISATVHAIYDGTNDPISSAYNHAAWADQFEENATVSNQYTLGACAISLAYDNANPDVQTKHLVLNDLSSVNIDFGSQVTKRGGPENVWPTFGALTKLQPSITLSGIEVGALDNAEGIKLLGTLARKSGSITGAASTIIQLRKRGMSGGFVDDATAEHIVINVSGLAYVTQPYSASGQDYGEIQITIETLWDGTNAPLIYNTLKPYTPAVSLD